MYKQGDKVEIIIENETHNLKLGDAQYIGVFVRGTDLHLIKGVDKNDGEIIIQVLNENEFKLKN
jgi:hypothetical protein